jgi:hypothetical protein
MFRLEFGVISNLSGVLGQKIDIVGWLVQKPFATLIFGARQIVQGFSEVPVEKWEYVVDAESGLKILESKKDPESLKRIRKLADELLK